MSYTIYELEMLRAMGFKFISNNKSIKKDHAEFNSLKMLNLQIKSCNLCQLCKSRNKAVIGSGDNYKVVFVFESPDIKSDKSGICAPSASLIRYLQMADISISGLYFTYILKCINKKSEPKYIDICSQFFELEIDIISPKFIVSFGENCFKYIAKNSSFDSHRGGVYRFKNSLYMPTFDSSWVDKNPSKTTEFISDLKKIKGYI
ncbi:uracil-DNA glycosylase family protein [Campylobacter lanienae]|uniref:uracil-DNA glycosylase family protein n=1 Tax=Campylobacter lanienae TaxID=75658 RepID=UPI000BB4315E|nr:uracil-DNA glycosylase family protein [Campylobacter lanienae]